MGENWIGVFPVEDALEMILIFNRTGEIIYANAAARNKLGYEPGLESGEESLEGKHISDVFPAGAGNSEAVLDTQAKHLVMYRKNRTCFPAET